MHSVFEEIVVIDSVKCENWDAWNKIESNTCCFKRDERLRLVSLDSALIVLEQGNDMLITIISFNTTYVIYDFPKRCYSFASYEWVKLVLSNIHVQLIILNLKKR